MQEAGIENSETREKLCLRQPQIAECHVAGSIPVLQCLSILIQLLFQTLYLTPQRWHVHVCLQILTELSDLICQRFDFIALRLQHKRGVFLPLGMFCFEHAYDLPTSSATEYKRGTHAKQEIPFPKRTTMGMG